MRRLCIALWIVCAANPQAGAQPPDAKSPAESLKCIQVRPGFTVELMAAEPLVKSPIAFSWGPDGKFWVVEMGDYPLGMDGKGKPGGRVKFVEKTKPGDGPYDKATVFLDGLPFPTGVTPYGKGVLICCAPDIFYAEDTDGDGKADKKEVLFTGFRAGNQQHRVNGLVWGLNNWFYGANGDSGGVVKSLKTGKTVDIRGRDFRLKPDTGAFEAVTGQTQFGRCRDDWGNWFGCNNTNPLYHFVLDDHYLRRNPYLLPPDPRVSVSETPGASRVYPISKPLPRFNSPQALNHFTSACSAMIYRDDLFGPEFAGNSFVSEPVHNLIHREIVKPKGVTFTSRRADDEKESEFLASSDNWFRPTTIATGPDGALWIADMYRYVIEHPEWIPKDWQAKLDLRAGQDKGRIYRVYPKGKQRRAVPRMDRMDAKTLVAQLESPNGWARDMAQQSLIRLKSHDTAGPALNQVARTSGNAKARLHAVCTLDGIQDLGVSGVVEAMKDEHPAVRKQAVSFAGETPGTTVSKGLAGLLDDPVASVRLQVGYALGTRRSLEGAPLLTRFLCANADDRYLLAAALSSVTKYNRKDLFAALAERSDVPLKVATAMLRLAEKSGEAQEVAKMFIMQHVAAQGLKDPDLFLRAAELMDAIADVKGLLPVLLKAKPKAGEKDIASHLKRIHDQAIRIATNAKSANLDRAQAVRLLARGIGDDRDDFKVLAGLLTPQTPDQVQAAAMRSLGAGSSPSGARVLLASWKGLSPSLRAEALDVLLIRPTWTRLLVYAIDAKQIPANEIDAVSRARLMENKDANIRDAATKLFARASDPNRGKLVDEYTLTLPPKADAKRGAKLFVKTCAACHKLGDVGQNVGPDLAAVGDRSISGLLMAILDPNRNVEARYVNYLATTKDGRVLTGIIATETSTSVALVSADGKTHNLLRADIDELVSTGKSLMPEGLEKDLPTQEMADLLAFVRGTLPAAKPKTFPGNQPQTIRPDKDGKLILPASSAAIFGPTLIFEQQYKNLGYWSSANDRAVWTLVVPKETRYWVHLDYACAPGSEGNKFVLEVAERRVTGTVASTGSWDRYGVYVDRIAIPPGTHALTVRAAESIRGALMDLKAIRLTPQP